MKNAPPGGSDGARGDRLSQKKIAPPRASNKRASEEAAKWLATLPPHVRKSIPAPSAGTRLVTPLAVKREANREADDARSDRARLTGKQRRIRGFEPVEHKVHKGVDGQPLRFLVETDRKAPKYEKPTADDAVKRSALERVLRQAQPIEPPPGRVVYENAEVERQMTAFHGKASSEALEQVRVAYRAIFGASPPEPWEQELRARVRFTLGYRLAGSKPPKGHPSTGTGILSGLKSQYGASVPVWLTAADIDVILRSATLTRGGGKSGKQNVERAIDDLMANGKLR